jgi:hypothetical protein
MPEDQSTSQLDQLNIPFSDYKKVARDAIKSLVETWNAEQLRTEERRKTRYNDIDIEGEKDSGTLDKDEIFTPIFLIDSNIKKEQAKKAAYLTKSPRAVILSCNEDSSISGAPIENDFTTKARYNEWELDLLRWVDGSETHAWDWVEIVFDADKPGHFAVEHIGHENLFYVHGSKHVQKSDFIVRVVDVTPRDLAKLVRESGFDAGEVNKILCSNKNESNNTNTSDPKIKDFSNRRIEKVFFKHHDGFVYVGWSCASICEGNWLREPKKLFLGQVERNPAFNPMIQGSQEFIQLYETSYPIEPLIYSISENECLEKMKGRVDLDAPKQEGATSLLSTALTSFRRSANLYWTPADGGNDGTAWDEAQTDQKLIPNRVFTKALKQLQLEHVDVGIFQGLHFIMGQSQQEAGDMNFAIFSNKSTRKTSAEVKSADKTDTLLSTVGATLLSIAYRNVCTRCFNIYRSRALAGLVKVNTVVLDLLAKYTWTLKPAGDTDVIERAEKIKRMQDAWPVYEKTPARDEFLKILTKLLFPDEAAQIIKAMDEGNMQMRFIAAMMEIVKALVIDPVTNQLKQEYISEGPRIIQLLQQGQAILAQSASNGSVTPALPSDDGANMPQDDTVIEMPRMQLAQGGQ